MVAVFHVCAEVVVFAKKKLGAGGLTFSFVKAVPHSRKATLARHRVRECEEEHFGRSILCLANTRPVRVSEG